MVAVGTLISATWILSVNSWMQTPQGHEIIAGRVVPVVGQLPHALRREPLVIEDLLAPLRASGVTVEVDPKTPPIKGDAALLRFALTTLIHHCEAAALDRHETPDIRLRAQPWEFAVQIHVMCGKTSSAPEIDPQVDFDSEAEVTTVNAVLAQHNGYFVIPQGEVAVTHFTLQFDAL